MDGWPGIGIAVLVALVVLLALAIWSIKRHRDPKLRAGHGAHIRDLLGSLAGLSLATPVPGNRVEVLENGAFFDALLAGIGAARRSVHFESFLWKEGVLGARLADALADRARAGVAVRVLLDATGSGKMGEAAEKRLREAGCKLYKYHRWDIRHIGVMNDRDHRKLAVIDGRVAFVGGHCIVDEWLGDAEDHVHYADVSVRVEGPVVHSVQGAFSENWTGSSGEMFMGEDVFPRLQEQGDVTAFTAFVKPEGSAPAIKILHHGAICCARERIWIQNPYFIPEPAAIDAMGEAVERGVDVRVLMPGTSGSDNPIVQHAGHRNFEKLLRCGVRLFEYPHTLLHQKVMTIDREWCMVGSANFDDRSFETNDELTLGFLDAATARKLDGIFEKYAARAEEIRLEVWSRRSRAHRLLDHAYYLVNEML